MSAAAPLRLRGQIADQVHTWPLEGEVAVVGRSSRCTVHLPDGTVSKEHAEIRREGDAWRVRDLGSRNGTRVNGRDVVGAVAIRSGDRIEFGQVVLDVVSDGSPSSVRFNDATVMGSSLRLRADQILERQSRGAATGRIVHVLAEAGRLLVRPKPLTETCDELLSFVEKTVHASRYVLLLQTEPGAEPVQVAARTPGGRANQPLVLSRSIMRKVMDECASVLTADAAVDPRFQGQQSIVAQSVRSAMAVPLFDNERVLGVLYVDSQDRSSGFNEEQLELLTLLANMSAVKITNARLLEADQQRARLRQEIATAAEIQRGMLTAGTPALPGWEFDVFLQSCYEVGGDLYDVHVAADGRVTLLLGDVTGKGLGAALLMSSFLASARVLYDTGLGLADLAARLGKLVHASTDSGRFITGFLARLDPAAGTVEYVNAGHPSPCLVGPRGLLELESTGVPFGILPDFRYGSSVAQMPPGALLAVFSDGIPEAQKGEEFFDEERLHAALREAAALESIEGVRRAVLARVEEFLEGAPRTDDMTLMLIRRAR